MISISISAGVTYGMVHTWGKRYFTHAKTARFCGDDCWYSEYQGTKPYAETASQRVDLKLTYQIETKAFELLKLRPFEIIL